MTLDALTNSVNTALQSQYISDLSVDELKDYKESISSHPDSKKMWSRLTHTIKSIANGQFRIVINEEQESGKPKGLCICIEYPEDGKKYLPLSEVDRIADKYQVKVRNVKIGVYWFM